MSTSGPDLNTVISMKWTFTLPELMGAVRTTQRAKFCDPRYKRYAQYKTLIRAIANQAGVPDDLDPKKRYSLTIIAYWTKKARCDLDNVLKAVLDGLFKQDRRVLSYSCHAIENAGLDEAQVEVVDSTP